MKTIRRKSVSVFKIRMNLNKFNVFVISGIVLFLCFLNIQARFTTEEPMIPFCDETEACGWGFFDPEQRYTDIIFKKNKKCVCEPGFVCALIGIDATDKDKEIPARCHNSSDLKRFNFEDDNTTCKTVGKNE